MTVPLAGARSTNGITVEQFTRTLGWLRTQLSVPDRDRQSARGLGAVDAGTSWDPRYRRAWDYVLVEVQEQPFIGGFGPSSRTLSDVVHPHCEKHGDSEHGRTRELARVASYSLTILMKELCIRRFSYVQFLCFSLTPWGSAGMEHFEVLIAEYG